LLTTGDDDTSPSSLTDDVVDAAAAVVVVFVVGSSSVVLSLPSPLPSLPLPVAKDRTATVEIVVLQYDDGNKDDVVRVVVSAVFDDTKRLPSTVFAAVVALDIVV
jgi:hypothetical protein